ncbi:MAG: SRPBCC domain-containing protein [Pararhodobacter sp.]|nr:SRPBCC domain-containing protein [Pararhodobacter sp.]
MTEVGMQLRSVVKERRFAQSPEKVWRALTQKYLIADWLMANDFKPEVGHRFVLDAEWGQITCDVLAVEPQKFLSYSWQSQGLDSVVTWTLTSTADGTHLKMVQTGFGADQELAYRGATTGWTRFLDRLEVVVCDHD